MMLGFLFVGFNVSNGVAYSGNLLGLVVRNGDTEFLLEFHDELYGVEAVSAEIGGECCGFGYLTFVYAELVDDDCFYAILQFQIIVF